MTKGVPEATAAQIFTYGPRDETGQYAYCEVAATWSQTGNELLLPIGTRVAQQQMPPLPVMANEPFLIRDTTDPATPPEQQQFMQGLGMRAMLVYALIAGSQPVGLLVITYREPRLFMAAETQPLQALTGQVAVTLRNQQLVREEAIAVKQLDEVNRRLTSQAWEEYARATGAVTYKEDSGPATNASSVAAPTVLAAPIMIHGEEVGVLRLEDAASDREWTPNELALTRAVAGEVAIALENARLIEETGRRANRERTINRITSRIRNAPSIDQMLAVAAQELRAETRAARSVAEIGPQVAGQEDVRS
jgi:GAF domain-containing protein